MPEPTKPADGSEAGGAAGAVDDKKVVPPEAPKPITFSSQEELDRIIADRVRRAIPSDYEDLKKLKAAKDAEAEAEKTELQKEKDARKAAEVAAKEKDSRANTKLVRAELLTEAAAQNALDSDIVVALLQGSTDITVNDEGEVRGAKEAVAKLLKDKPILVKGKVAASGAEFGGNDPKARVAKIAELEARMNDPKLSQSERQAAGRDARSLKLEQNIA
jgi:hypothetical protein